MCICGWNSFSIRMWKRKIHTTTNYDINYKLKALYEQYNLHWSHSIVCSRFLTWFIYICNGHCSILLLVSFPSIPFSLPLSLWLFLSHIMNWHYQSLKFSRSWKNGEHTTISKHTCASVHFNLHNLSPAQSVSFSFLTLKFIASRALYQSWFGHVRAQ